MHEISLRHGGGRADGAGHDAAAGSRSGPQGAQFMTARLLTGSDKDRAGAVRNRPDRAETGHSHLFEKKRRIFDP